MVGPLTGPASHGGAPADAFDAVVPSLPEFGWSGKPGERGWGISRMGAAFDMLMARPAELSQVDPALAANRAAFPGQETAQSAVKGTKPDSLTVGQTAAPAGVAAWAMEKFRAWSDCGGSVEGAFSKHTLLTNPMFHGAANGVASAA